MSISPISKPTSLDMITLVMNRLVLMTGISSFKCSDPFWTQSPKYQVPGFRIVTHFTRIVARTWEWLGTVTGRWRSPPEELSGRILQQKLSKNFQKNFKKTFRGTFRRTFRQNLAAEQIFLPKNVQMFLKVFRPTQKTMLRHLKMIRLMICMISGTFGGLLEHQNLTHQHRRRC